nr:MAG TPA: hypothetical protein [Caudoviricetes sp.]
MILLSPIIDTPPLRWCQSTKNKPSFPMVYLLAQPLTCHHV